MIVPSSLDVTKFYKGFLTMEDEKDNKLFYGVELECYTINHGRGHEQYKSLIDLENAMYGHAIIKPDCGSEIVTVPATLRYHKEQLWNKFFSGVNEGFKGGAGAGLHIHVSRDAMTPLQLAKVICFVNEAINTNFLTKIAGREVRQGTMYCGQLHGIPRDVDSMLAATKHSKSNAMQISSRNAGKTAELRIFSSNPTQQGVFQALEFIDCLIQYCDKHGNLESQMSYEAFVKWFVDGGFKHEYPYLNTNLVNLGFIMPVSTVVGVAGVETILAGDKQNKEAA